MTFLELEKKCKRRRVFKLLRYFIFILIFLIGFSSSFYLLKKENNKSKKKEINITKQIGIKTLPKKEYKLNIVKKESIEKLDLYIDLNINEKKEKKTNKNVKISTNKLDNEKRLIKSDILPSYETCIKLAKNYFQQKDYQNALKWAKNANIQDNKRSEAWIITAKSLIKLGKKKQAKEILEIYYKFSKNKEVLKLIKEIDE